MNLDSIDIASHDAWVDGIPHDQLTLLRREAPVFRHERTDPSHPEFFWCLTRHADVQMVNRDWETFSSQRGGVQLVAETNEDFRTMIDTDPPDHTRLRRLVNRGLTPRMVAQFEQHYRDLTGTILDRAIEKGSFDFVTEVAAELPLVAIAELLGIPVEDRHKIFDWTNKLVGNSDPEYVTSEEEPLIAAAELYSYANQLAEARRSDPRDDIVTKLISQVDGDALGPHEFETFVLLLAVAGNETTRNAISHGVHALMNHPDQWDLLCDPDADVMTTAVEEIVRWASPVINFKRTATRDVEIRGVPIAAGDPVVLYYISANRDEDVFDDPFRLDLRRSPNDHVGFGGGGPHFCLGANLARIEIRLMFEELVARVRSIEPNGDVDRLRSNFINGIKRLPVTVTPR